MMRSAILVVIVTDANLDGILGTTPMNPSLLIGIVGYQIWAVLLCVSPLRRVGMSTHGLHPRHWILHHDNGQGVGVRYTTIHLSLEVQPPTSRGVLSPRNVPSHPIGRYRRVWYLTIQIQHLLEEIGASVEQTRWSNQRIARLCQGVTECLACLHTNNIWLRSVQ